MKALARGKPGGRAVRRLTRPQDAAGPSKSKVANLSQIALFVSFSAWPASRVVLLLLVTMMVAFGLESNRPEQSAAQPTVRPGDSPRVLPRLLVRAKVFERPKAWTPLLSIPFGPARSRLGAKQDPGKGSPVFPLSFTVARDGSFWILDVVKQRVAHYSRRGTYLGSLRGVLRPGRPLDLALVREVIYVVEQNIIAVELGVRELRQGRPARVTSLVWRGRMPLIYELVPNQARLTAATLGVLDGAASNRTGKAAVVWFEVPGSGRMHALPGHPVKDGFVSVDLRGIDPNSGRETYDSVEITHRPKKGAATSRKITVEILTRPGGKPVHALAGAEDVVPFGDSVGLCLLVSSDGGGLGGRWYLQLSADGAVQVWERVRRGTIWDDSFQERHITVGPDGSMYHMIADRSGIKIFRRG
jgi:hypothetical protein